MSLLHVRAWPKVARAKRAKRIEVNAAEDLLQVGGASLFATARNTWLSPRICRPGFGFFAVL